jgi:hypothetical protein
VRACVLARLVSGLNESEAASKCFLLLFKRFISREENEKQNERK